MKPGWALLAAFCPLWCACGSAGSERHVPKPEAFARIALYDTVYSPVDFLPVRFEANTQAACSLVRRDERVVWADVAYPAYRGVINVTFTHVADSSERSDVAVNRAERMALNLGDARAEEVTLTSPGGFHTTILAARSASLMPVQFLSVGEEWVVSGAFSLDSRPRSVDSVKPVVDAVTNDLIHAAQCLGPK